MARRHLAAGLAALCIVAGLAAALALRAPAHNAVLNATPIGNPSMVGVDSRLGRAFILDDGVLAQQVTLDNHGGMEWTDSNTSNTLHVLDTRTGRIIKAIDVPTTFHSIIVDAATNRVFAFEQDLLQGVDARDGTLLNPVSVGIGSDDLNDYIDTALVDERTGHIFATLDQSASDPVDQHLLILDGRTGKTLRNLTFPHGLGNTSPLANGASFISYGPSLSLALDERASRLYVFNTNGRMSSVDTRSGRVLSTRRLPVALMSAQADGRSGRIFAFVVPHGPVKLHTGRWQWPTHTLVMLDPRTGTLRAIASVTGFGGITIDEDDNRVFIPDITRRAVTVFDGANGRILRTVALGLQPFQVVLDEPRHRALVTLAAGYNATTADTHIAMLDTRSGALLRAISTGHPLNNVTIDTGTGHLVTTYDTMSSGQPDDRYSWMPSWLRAHLPWIPAPPPPPPALNANQRIITHTALTLDPS